MQDAAQYDLSARLSLDSAACLTIRRPDTARGAACDICAATCPGDAITIDARTIVLDHDECIGCGRCAAACPTGALAWPVRLMESADRDSTSLTLECSRVRASHRSVDTHVVTCLGGVSSGQLRDALRDFESVTLMDRGWCGDCPAGGCSQPWAERVAAVSDDMTRLECDANRLRVTKEPLPHAQADPAPQPARPVQQTYSRRQLFRRLATPPSAPDRSRVVAAQPFSGKIGVPALLDRRTWLLALSRTEQLDANFFPALDVCGATDLRLAASLCPTAALELHEDSDADRLIFDAAFCLGCGECEAGGGLSLRASGEGTYYGPVTLVSEPMADCPKCLRRFAPRAGQHICDACHKDDDLAASAFGLMRRSQMPYGA